MNGRVFALVILGLGLVACGSSDRSFESAGYSGPPMFGAYAATVPGVGSVNSSSISLTGHLEGRLYNVLLSSDTTSNSGILDRWNDGGGSLQVDIATEGIGGAGMLIVGISMPSIDAALSGGYWSTADSVTGSVVVNSCAGPVMDQWDHESPAVDFEMSACEDPEDPSTVVVQIKAQFPLSDEDADALWDPAADRSGIETSELWGSFSFARPTAL